MTAILCLTHLDGVLMLSDTEESIGPYAKSQSDKLHRFIFKHGNAAGTVLTGGAGNAHLIECANQELERFFTSELQGGDDILSSLDVFARTFFEESMRGYQGLAPELVPDMSMLLAVSVRPQTRLFRWEGNRVLMLRSTHATIGSGITHIHPMLWDTQFSGMCDTMLLHGVRMMFHAKRAVAGVGGRTEAISLHNDGTTHLYGTETIQKVEELVVNLDQFITKIMYLNISATSTDIKDIDKNVEANLAKLPKIMQLYRGEYKNILKPPVPQ